jgi:hypothetical protein
MTRYASPGQSIYRSPRRPGPQATAGYHSN